jgi:hypothetical protein
MSRPTGELTPNEQRARVAAVRGLLRAREHLFDAARTAFTEAATLDPRLDLAKIPNFWSLPRGGQQAAIDAYELAGRERDAFMLVARVRRAFRPRLVPLIPGDPTPIL